MHKPATKDHPTSLESHSDGRSYAIRAIARLSMHPQRMTLLEDLCEGTDLRKPFMAKVLQGLVLRGVVKTVNGSDRGFVLAHHPSEMKISDIISSLEGVEGLDH